MEIIRQTQINKIQNETLHMKRAKEPRLIINDPWRNLINSIFFLFSFPFFFFFFFLFNAKVGEFIANLLPKNYLHTIYFSHTN